MSEPLTLARPYARAAFEAAQEQGALTAWADKLAIATRILADSRIHALVGDPRLGHADLVRLLLPPDEAPDSAFAAFLGLLVENRRVELLGDILALFEQYKREAEHVLKVTLRTAVAISSDQHDAIRQALKKRFRREIQMQQQIDPDVVGGAVIDAGDLVIDGSVRGRLARLETALTH